jgi:hypothetical protein
MGVAAGTANARHLGGARFTRDEALGDLAWCRIEALAWDAG